jgi:trehalose synthase
LPPTFVWPPAIDPLTPKNMALSPEDAQYVVDQFGIDVSRPLLTQVSRFDPWKDPLGVIDAYRLVKQTHPDVQLALVGSMAHDDPEGWDYYSRTVDYAAGDADIHILSNLNNVGAVEVNAFQVCSSVVLQKSIREGFGLTVSEALWKARPTVAGNVGGIVSQIEHGVTGWLVDSPAEAAAAVAEALDDPGSAKQRAIRGKELVRRRFLTPRLLRDWLLLFNRLLGNATDTGELVAVADVP